jgi:GT2 family glycosyltransferase
MLSIIVLGYNNFEKYTLPCLNSLMAQLTENTELILVENQSPDGSDKLAFDYAQHNNRLTFIQSPINAGFAGGMNLGAREAKGDWLLLTNNDTIFPPSAIQRLLAVLQAQEKDIGAVGLLTNQAGNGQHLNFTNASLQETISFGEKLHTLATGLVFPADRLDFFCVAIRKACWEELNGLDTGYGRGYYEDFDFSLRATAKGWKQVITEDVFVLHVGSGAFSSVSAEQKKLLKQNKKRLKRIHPTVVFTHKRLENLSVLNSYRYSKSAIDWTNPGIQLRLEKRLLELANNNPKSLMKRWLWKRKSGELLAFFRQVGLRPPQQPTLQV